MAQVKNILKGIVRFALWLGFAAVFYHSGLGLTTWLLEPERAGHVERLLGLLFPLLLIAFFYVNRRLGCYGSGACALPRQPSSTLPPGH